MDWQQPAALGIVALTVAAFWWRQIRRPRRSKLFFGKQGGCCSQTPDAPVQASILYRARKGERPQVILKYR